MRMADNQLSDSRPLINVYPETLVFELSPNKQVGCPLYVSNTCGVTVAFKVKTTEPRRYLVRPNQGLVPPGETTTISVYLVEKESHELLQAPASLGSIGDKFLVQTAAVGDKEAAALMSSPSNYNREQSDHSEEVSKLWGNFPKSSIRNKKLAVRVKVSPDAGEILSPSTPGRPVGLSPSRPLNINASSPLPSPSLARSLPVKAGPYSAGSSGRGVGSSAAGGAGAGSGGLDVDARVLANKYEDLVNYTANLTEERDELNQALEKAKKALQREMAARIALESKGHLQHGRKGPPRGAGGARATSHLHHRSAGGFGLVTLMIVALIFFLLGHWLDLTSGGKGTGTGATSRSNAAAIDAAGIMSTVGTTREDGDRDRAKSIPASPELLAPLGTAPPEA